MSEVVTITRRKKRPIRKPGETKRESSVRMANGRMNKALHALRNLTVLFNKNNELTENDYRAMRAALDAQLVKFDQVAELYFNPPPKERKQPEPLFALE
jgi:hypothetical protein